MSHRHVTCIDLKQHSCNRCQRSGWDLNSGPQNNKSTAQPCCLHSMSPILLSLLRVLDVVLSYSQTSAVSSETSVPVQSPTEAAPSSEKVESQTAEVDAAVSQEGRYISARSCLLTLFSQDCKLFCH